LGWSYAKLKVRFCAPAPAIQPAAAATTIAPHNILRPAFATFIMLSSD